ncbi:mannitol 2-dehydrogenase protein [Marine Group I thaumarchaeote SCGC AAA799-E16]|uniref:Mannitol 2-dehydrogenase protein n=2 Tax=Marine Group I TaxID=905826 RepID=A0A087RVZ5_9ARCH|nr:mannitol 2-dehydrogenase protein [Marine Group I thaumarchaeote SCGC AAA799-E16]KFM17649.1 mannitol 2-dehydrogenase protein [Marine Group I thaumarchaeote SCGC RSA3]
MKFQELTDKQWSMIEQHIPPHAKTGRPRDDDRRIFNGIIYVLTTGCRWQDMPKRYGDDSTANRRLNLWQQKGVWQKILSCAIKSTHKSGKMNLQKISVDSSTVSAKKGEMK